MSTRELRYASRNIERGTNQRKRGVLEGRRRGEMKSLLGWGWIQEEVERIRIVWVRQKALGGEIDSLSRSWLVAPLAFLCR